MKEPEHIELQVPECYQKQKLLFQMIVTIQTNLAILTASFIVQHFTNLKVIYQSTFLSITVIILMNFINYQRDCHQMPNSQLFMHPFPIITLIVGLSISLKIYGYSLLLTIICFFIIIYNLISMVRKKTKGWCEEIINSILLILLCFFLLSLEEFIVIDLKYILFLPLLLLFLLLYVQNIYFIRQFLANKTNYNQVFMSKERLLYLMITTNAITSNLIGLLLWNFINRQYLIFFFKLVTTLNLICIILAVTMFQQILLMTTMPQYQSDQTIFRVSSKKFVNYFQKRSKIIISSQQSCCVLCELPATVVKMPCGHLTTCLSCNKKSDAKVFYDCIICKSFSNRTNILQPIRKRGYKRRFFIEKKLKVNEYVI